MKESAKVLEVKTHGGKRKNAGRKKAYKTDTTTIAFRAPKNKVKEIKTLVKAKLKEYKVSNPLQ